LAILTKPMPKRRLPPRQFERFQMSLDTLTAIEILGPDGPIAKYLDDYEMRPQQVTMAQAVENAFINERNLIAEAGTGVGKSFAYLIPAILTSRRTRQPVVISTGTIALQEQLLRKDIPFLQEVLKDIPFTVALAKGRSNYVCPRRLAKAEFQPKDKRILDRIRHWAARTKDGSRTDLDFKVYPYLWQQVCSDRYDCKKNRCKGCFYYYMRSSLAKANIVVVNHSLLLINAMLPPKARIIPNTSRLILDEAHELEDIASTAFGTELRRSQIDYLLSDIARFMRNDADAMGVTGLLSPLNHAEEAMHPAYADLKAAMGRGKWSSRAKRIKIPLESRSVDALIGALAQLGKLFEYKHSEAIAEYGTEDEAVIRMDSIIQRSMSFAHQLEQFANVEAPDAYVYWISQTGAKTDNITLNIRPIEVAKLFEEYILDQASSVILTSATLATDAADSPWPFGHFRQRLGFSMGGEDFFNTGNNYPGSTAADELQVDTPFNYAEQVSLYIPYIAEPKAETYLDEVTEEVLEAIKKSAGGVLVLFTSYLALNTVYSNVEDRFYADGVKDVVCLKQDSGGNRGKLLDAFVHAPQKAVLFGTESFWKGIDVPGDSLTTVVITKLPFPVPTDPLHEARMEAIERHGGDPFVRYSEPHALIKLKQGFGRLIRRSTDKGRVVILDSRLLSRRKGYGKRFLAALPQVPREDDN